MPLAFPTLGVTDSFKRTENPLSNGGKWSLLTGAEGTGETKEVWVNPISGPGLAGARWNVSEQANPAVAIEVTATYEGYGNQIGVWSCLSAAARSGYRLAFTIEGKPGKGPPSLSRLWTLEYWSAGERTVLASFTGTAVKNGDSLGITLREGLLIGWHKASGTWTPLLQARDSRLTKGYTGFDVHGFAIDLANFASGEMPTGPFGASELTGITPVTIEGSTYLIAAAGKNLYSLTSGGVVSVIGEGFTEGLNWSIVQAPKGTKKTGGPVWLSNGTDKPQYWTGAEKATKVHLWEGESATIEEKVAYEDPISKEHVPNGKYMIFAGNRIWMTGIPDDPSAVRFSEDSPIGAGGEQGDPSWWPANNVVRFDSSDGYPITGIGVVGAYVLVFKEHKTWAIHNLDTGENRKLSDSVGCVSHRSITETSNGTFFLTADQGIYTTDGAKLVEMSYKVRPTILAIDPAKREQAAGGFYNNHYYLSFAFGTSTVNNRTLDYDFQLKSWWLHDLAGRQWAKWSPAVGEPNLFTIPPTRASVVRAFVPGLYTDSGENYIGNGALGAWWVSAWEPFAYYVFRHRIKAPFLKKRVRQIFFNGSGEINPIVYKDFGTAGLSSPGTVGNSSSALPTFPVNFSQSETIYGNLNEEQLFAGEVYEGVQMIFGGSAETAAARLYAPGIAFVWSVGFGNNSSSPFEVDAFTYMLQFRKS